MTVKDLRKFILENYWKQIGFPKKKKKIEKISKA